ncbi:hypothetical protein [Hydrogenophaga sp.]|uniref:hypothetical protein n=1 Tax=Hydrogenophaga sp. TaxID=1904254 RepID=UPI002732289D|nr:hypothetical protein [Hydrogenophaga sp.]MDP1684091.1 hypothetical protein [Hydrogenophaga sp.]MDP1781440.1 hypothetical protein [Hydrogenophaga sp.]MDP2250340.1 hypothetical protein [Hydrogenophaga sp.]
MNPRPTTRSAALSALAGFTLLAVTGCATPPPVAERMEMSPMGTVTTYHRKSSGSLGTFDGQVVWTHAPATWQGKPVISFGAPQAGVALHDPVSFGMLATLHPDGRPAMSFDPPLDYAWPLTVGQTWSSQYTVTLHASGAKVPLKRDFKVEAIEDVTVPAGTFKTWKISWKDSTGETETRWISPAQGIATVKRHVERPATHAQGAGVLDAVLLSRVLPAR